MSWLQEWLNAFSLLSFLLLVALLRYGLAIAGPVAVILICVFSYGLLIISLLEEVELG